MASRFARALVRAFSAFVPARERDPWRREWLAEIERATLSAAHSEPGAPSPVRLLARAVVSGRDALQLRARRAAGTEFLPPDQAHRHRALDELRQDLRFGMRSLLKAPGFASVALLTMALGIGTTTMIFSLVNGILLQTLQYRDPGRLVAIWPEMHFWSALFELAEPRLDAYESFAGFAPWDETLATSAGVERVWVQRATAGFLEVLGPQMLLGRALLPASGLLIKSFMRLSQVDPGLQADGLVTVNVNPEAGTLASATAAGLYYERIVDSLTALPGIRAVSTIWKGPFTEDGGINALWRADEEIDPSAQVDLGRWRPVDTDYFATTGIRLMRGRLFEPSDASEPEQVTVVSEAAARALFPGSEALGQRILTSMDRGIPLRIVGVVADLKLAGLDRQSPSVIYQHYGQVGPLLERHGFYDRWLLIRLEGPPDGSMASTVRATIGSLDPTALVSEYSQMSQAIDRSLSRRRVTMTILSLFAATAISLGAVGIYGVMAYSVRRRQREIGIRVALGATRSQVVGSVVTEALRMAAMGAISGLAITALLSRTIESFLFQVDAVDPAVMAISAAMAGLIAAVAAAAPALRASRADPVETLAADA